MIKKQPDDQVFDVDRISHVTPGVAQPELDFGGALVLAGPRDSVRFSGGLVFKNGNFWAHRPSGFWSRPRPARAWRACDAALAAWRCWK